MIFSFEKFIFIFQVSVSPCYVYFIIFTQNTKNNINHKISFLVLRGKVGSKAFFSALLRCKL